VSGPSAPVIRPLLLTALLACAALGGYAAYLGLAAPEGAPPAREDGTPRGHVPAFVLDDLDGEPRATSAFLGRPLVINFWATWCPPCLREMPLLADLHARHGDTLQVLGIAIDRAGPVREFAERHGIDYPLLVGEQAGMELAAEFGDAFRGLPFTVFADAEGRIVEIHLGEMFEDELRAAESVMLALARGEIDTEAARARWPASGPDRTGATR